MSLERPEPPSGADSPEELVAHVTNNPSDWLMYLRYINGYAAALKKENDLFRIAESDHNATLQPLRSTVAKQEGIIEYQKTQYKEDTALLRKEIAQLEVEKARLLDAAIPAVQIPRSAPADTPNTPAEQPADSAPRPTALAPSIHSGSSHLSEKIPNPNEFDGSRNDLRRFTQQIYGKMTANADRFPTAIARLTYVAGRLTGKAYELILPKTRFGVPEFLDYPEMLAYLENAFGDPDRVQNAQNKLYQLKQKNLDFSTFFSEFQRLALEGEMPEDALAPLLFQGISRELQDMLLHSPTPSRKYRDYADHLQALDNRFRQHQQQVSRNRIVTSVKTPTNYATAAAPRQSTTASPDPSKRDWRAQRPVSPVAAGGDPMDLSSQRRFAPGGRKERGECFRCGSKNHRVAVCPEPDNRPSSQFRQFRASYVHRPGSPDSARSVSPPPSPPSPTNGVSLS
jgi:cell division septation protein DedD